MILRQVRAAVVALHGSPRIDFDEAANGVMLPKNTVVSKGYKKEMGPPHSRVHNNEYANALADRLEAAAAQGKGMRDKVQVSAAEVSDQNSQFPGVRWWDEPN